MGNFLSKLFGFSIEDDIDLVKGNATVNGNTISGNTSVSGNTIATVTSVVGTSTTTTTLKNTLHDKHLGNVT